MLSAPEGAGTRPTADRVRQALFDRLMHAPWFGRARLEGAQVLDAFAGTGALGLEALSRGAAHVTFLERDRAALRSLRANVAACGAGDRSAVVPADVLTPPLGEPVALLFLDPPYARGVLPDAVAALRRAGWIGAETVVVTESGVADPVLDGLAVLSDAVHGVARMRAYRAG